MTSSKQSNAFAHLSRFGIEPTILVLDPDRDNQVLGYLRLKSASPDQGHFAEMLESPLLERDAALDMVDRYYGALNARDEASLREVTSENWTERGASPSVADQDAEAFMEELASITAGLEDGRFAVEAVHLADDVVTVRGTISGRHAGTLFGVPATGREVSFGAIALHRIADGEIAETWQMADWATLMRLITQ